MNTEEITFYHGTGAEAAEKVLRYGAKDRLFHEIGAFDLGRLIRHALLTIASVEPKHDYLLHQLFESAGSKHSGLCVPALQQVDCPQENSVFDYGSFFVTMNISNAYRYALSPYRSEFIRVLAESLKVLQQHGHPLVASFVDQYPVVARLISAPSPPVVLEFRGIRKSRLSPEKSGDSIELMLEIDFELMGVPGASTPGAYRIHDVNHADIIAVHDVRAFAGEEHDVMWKPDPQRVAQIRCAPKDWLESLLGGL
jgi:hypothetical protein